MLLLAQADLYAKLIDAVEKGSTKAAEGAPSLWIMAAGIIGALGVMCVLSWLFLKEVQANRVHVEGLFNTYATSTKSTAESCHAHGERMSERSDEKMEALTEAVHELKDSTGDLKGMTSDLRAMTTETRQFVQTAMVKIQQSK